MKLISTISVLAALTLAGCSSGGGTDNAADPTTLTVFAAASLTDVFDQIATDFEKENPGADVTFSFAGSSDLVSQISEGAPADIIATADERTMDTLADDGLLSAEPSIFASNTLTLAVGKGNPEHIEGAADLTGHDLVVCAPQVPCGAATQKWADATQTMLRPVSEENSVTDVLGKVSAGQADAGIVYVTDIARADDIERVDLEGADKVVNRYPAATVKASEHQELATAFVKYLRSDAAAALLQKAGFSTP